MKRRLLFLFLPFVLSFAVLFALFRPETTAARPDVTQVVANGDAAAAIPLNNNIYNAGRITVYNQAVFGPACQTYYGDAFSPVTSLFRPPNYYTNPNYSPQFFSYRYRIDIPPDYELRADSTVVRVELFDPETANTLPIPSNTYTITHSDAYVAQGNPPTSTGICDAPIYPNTQQQPCVFSTNETDSLNPFWFIRVDENRSVVQGTCVHTSFYSPAANTDTAFDLYYYHQITDTVAAQPVATYIGRKDNEHDTDMRWVSPGAAQSYDQPTFVPVTSGPGSFEVDLELITDIVVDPVTGIRSLYVDVTTLDGSSENGFDIWAGPPGYTGPANPTDVCSGGVPSEVNARNLHIINCDYHSHDSAGVTIYALDYWPTNYNTGTPIEKRVVYVGPEYAGHSLYIHLFDSDIGTFSPIVFTFDTLAFQVQNPVPMPPADPTDPTLTDWYRAFAVNNTLTNDPDLLPGQSRNCRPGTCNDRWITPPYRIDVPTMSPDCVDVQTTPQLCTPFHGGWLMVRYIPARTDTVTWRVELPELPPENTVDSCPAFPITFDEEAISINETDYNTVLMTNPNQMYPATPAPYGRFYYHTPGHLLQRGPNEAQPGDIFLLEGEGWNDAYGFLMWNRDDTCPGCNQAHVRLQNSLTWPGDSLDPVLGFREAAYWTDTHLQIGDRVNSSLVEGSAVTEQLAGHIDRGRVLRLLVYNQAGVIHGGGQGNSDLFYVKVAQFATFRLLGYHLDGTSLQRWLLVEFMGWDELCGRPGPTVAFTENSYQVNEGDTGITLTVALSQPYTDTVTVAYETTDNTATAGQDYAAASGTLTFTAGTVTQTIPLTILTDLAIEGHETFSVTLSNPINGNIIGVNPVPVTIIDNDTPSLISFTVSALAVGEGDGLATVVVQQNGVYTGTVSVNYLTIATGAAIPGLDYTPVNGTLIFDSGILSRTVTIPILNDLLAEVEETFLLQLANPTNGVIGGINPLVITIMDNDLPGTIQFAAASVSVSEEATQVQVVVAQSGAQDTATVQYTTSNGSAAANQDYTPVTGTLVFPVGVPTQTITIPILEDTVLEGAEAFFLTLSNPVNGVITGTNPLIITIADNEEPAEIGFAAATLTVVEDEGTAQIVVQHNSAHTSPLQVSYATSNGTATAGADYIHTSGIVAFGSSPTATITIPIINDPLLEGDETFFLTLSNPVNGVIMGTNPMTITITNDDSEAEVGFVVTSLTVAEDEGTAQVIVQQNGVHGSPVQVNVATSNGTATAGLDYIATNTILTFNPGVLTQTVTIPILNDTLLENSETLALTLSDPVNAVVVGTNPIIITIEDNEELAQISFAATAISVPETAGQVQVVIQQNQAHTSPLSIFISTSNGTATAGQDYTPTGGTVNFNGAAAITVTIQLNNDTLPEGHETFFVTLANPFNGTITGINPLQIIILDDECLFAPVAAPGRIEAEDFACGGQGVAYHDTTPGNAGTSNYRLAEDVDVWDSAAALQTHYVGNTVVGEWLAYSVVVTEAGRYDLSLAAAATSQTQVRIVMDGVDVTGVLVLPGTGGGENFVEVAAAVGLQLSAGTHQIRVFILTSGVNLDYLLLSPTPQPPRIFLPLVIKPG
jgi:hypothetical protein